jgi:hypothetical protein
MESNCNCSIYWGLLGREYRVRVLVQILRGLVAEQQSNAARHQAETAISAAQHQKRVAKQQDLIQQHRAQIKRQRAQLAAKQLQSAQQHAEICVLTKRLANLTSCAGEKTPGIPLEWAHGARRRRLRPGRPANQGVRMGCDFARLQIPSRAPGPGEAPLKGLFGCLCDLFMSIWSSLAGFCKW